MNTKLVEALVSLAGGSAPYDMPGYIYDLAEESAERITTLEKENAELKALLRESKCPVVMCDNGLIRMYKGVSFDYDRDYGKCPHCERVTALLEDK